MITCTCRGHRDPNPCSACESETLESEQRYIDFHKGKLDHRFGVWLVGRLGEERICEYFTTDTAAFVEFRMDGDGNWGLWYADFRSGQPESQRQWSILTAAKLGGHFREYGEARYDRLGEEFLRELDDEKNQTPGEADDA